jgi:hypothetical protein
VTVADPRENKLPDVGLLELQDAETGETIIFDTGSKAARSKYELAAKSREAGFSNLFKSLGVDHVRLITDRDYILDLVKFFRMRTKKI